LEILYCKPSRRPLLASTTRYTPVFIGGAFQITRGRTSHGAQARILIGVQSTRKGEGHRAILDQMRAILASQRDLHPQQQQALQQVLEHSRTKKFQLDPRLDLVELEDQITLSELDLDQPDLDTEHHLDHFQQDPDYLQYEEEWHAIQKELLGIDDSDDDDDDSGGEGETEDDDNDDNEEEGQGEGQVLDNSTYGGGAAKSFFTDGNKARVFRRFHKPAMRRRNGRLCCSYATVCSIHIVFVVCCHDCCVFV
jgi:hypothetical protein